MSRAYRIRVRENLKRVLRAQDRVSTQLELLEILAPEQMAELLGEELVGRGFERKGQTAVRKEKGVTVTVELETGILTVESEAAQKVEVQGERETWTYDESGPAGKRTKQSLRDDLLKDLEKQVDRHADDVQTKATDKLEGVLGDLRRELDQAVNRVTAEALKRKAASMGQIKEMTEDPESGSLTITLEV